MKALLLHLKPSTLFTRQFKSLNNRRWACLRILPLHKGAIHLSPRSTNPVALGSPES